MLTGSNYRWTSVKIHTPHNRVELAVASSARGIKDQEGYLLDYRNVNKLAAKHCNTAFFTLFFFHLSRSLLGLTVSK